MHKVIVMGIALIIPSMAFADSTVAGQWQTVLDSNKKIDMDILSDGHWFSKNIQNNKIVRELSGTYSQTVKSPTTGKLVFTPNEKQAQVESDNYTISGNHKLLYLNNNGDIIKYSKQNLD
jgi:hypothetical protein